MASAMQAQATAAKHMMEQLNSRSKESVDGNDMDAKYHKFFEFRRGNPLNFKGTFDPDEAGE